MNAARAPRDDKTNVRLLVVRRNGEKELEDSSITHLPDHLRSGDLLVVNDAATLPASLHGWDEENNPLEIRLTTQLDKRVWQAVAFGGGDWRTPTEDRPSPHRFRQGEEITIRDNSRKMTVLDIAKEFASHQPVPAWMEIDRDNYKGRILGLPKREDIQLPVNEQLIVELYSK